MGSGSEQHRESSAKGDTPRRGLFGPEALLPTDEKVLMLVKPSGAWVFLRTPRRLVTMTVLLLGLIVWGVLMGRGLWGSGVELVSVLVLLLAAQIAWNTLQYEARWYAITAGKAGGRVISIGGVVGRYSTEVPLDAVRGITVARPWLERWLGVGGVGFGSAATGGLEVIWIAVSAPEALADRVRRQIESVQEEGPDA